jgi:hypothetical protein
LSLVLFVACSGDSADDGSGGGSETAVCEGLDAVRDDFGDVQQAVQRADVAGAQAAVELMRADMAELRSEVNSASPSDAVSQSAADLAGAVQGLETTIRQADDGGASVQGIVQQLAIQLPAIASSLNSLRSELKCP